MNYIRCSPADGRSVRLKLAWELLEVSPHKFVFAGKRQLRGIPADVWVAEKLPDTEDGPYSTIEIFFADPKYTVQIGSCQRNHREVSQCCYLQRR